MNRLPQELFEYCISIFRRLHSRPELGFDLPETVALVARELTDMGIPFTEKYGKGSLVGQIGSREGVPTLALRADMDALPVLEQVDVPYASQIPGRMHACGHDSHTAILLTVAKILKGMKDRLPCNVRLLFQPSEEGEISGARMMTEEGCLDGVDAILCTHCEGTIPTGTVGLFSGDYMAACVPITLTFHGVTSHATLPERGVDAVAMAVEAYTALKEMVQKEADGRSYIWSVGMFRGGEVHNVIPDMCVQKISFRFFDMEFADRVKEKTREILDNIAARYGGSVDMDWNMSCPPVRNDPDMVSRMRRVLEGLPQIRVAEVPRKKSSEDFSWYLTKVPGMLFRYGIYNPEKGCTSVPHRPDFKVDEDAMKTAVLTFVNFVMNYHS